MRANASSHFNRSGFPHSGMWGAALLFAFPVLCSRPLDQSGITTIHILNSAVQTQVKGFGINLGTPGFYGSGQMMKNLVFRNPGFEGLTYQSMIRCAAGSANTCADDNAWSAWPADFWQGASYEVIWGAAKGRTGSIASSSQAVSGSKGAVFQFSSSGAVPAPGDYLILRKTATGGADAGWWFNTGGGGSYSTELHDLPPGTPGQQSLRLTAGAGQSVSVTSYFDSLGGQNFLLLNGRYRLTFSAKTVSGSSGVQVQVSRVGQPPLMNQAQGLSSSWAVYNVDFNAAETLATPVSAVQMGMSYTGSGSILLDDVSLTRTDGDSSNPTAYRDAVVQTLRAYHPGVLRYWSGQLGDTMDNLTLPVAGRQRAGYSSYGVGQDDLQMGLHEFLELSAAIGAEPWVVLPITVSPAEASWLVDYLASSPGSAGGARRVSRGQTQPWTTVFRRIHLEFGNEAWNSIFSGGNMAYSQPYGNRAQEIFASMRANPNFPPASLDLVIGGQAFYPALNFYIQSACNNNDSFSTAPYQQSQVDSYGTLEQLWGPAFAEAESDVLSGVSSQNGVQVAKAAGGRTVNQTVYEVNLHTTSGTISQTALDSFTPALGAGLAVADHMLLLLKQMGAREQMLFALPQYNFQRADGKQVKLWGSVVDMGVTDRRRPQFLALQMVNQVLQGDMLATSHTGADPTWNQPLMNGVQLNNAHYLHSYAFSGDGRLGLVVVNLSRAGSLPVTFAGPNAPSGTVTLTQLTGSSPSDTNEAGSMVVPTTRTFARFNPSGPLLLPPFSLSVFSWSRRPELIQ